MSKSTNVAVVCGDLGNLIHAANPVMEQLIAMGATVNCYLDSTGTAIEGSRVAGVEYMTGSADSGDAIRITAGSEKILVALSAGARQLEQKVAHMATTMAKPTFGVEEMLLGRNNPGWNDQARLVHKLRTLFTSMPTEYDSLFNNIQVVGPIAVEWYRDQSVDAINREARRRLGVPEELGEEASVRENTCFIVVSFSPDIVSPHALYEVGQALIRLKNESALSEDTQLLLCRHHRELRDPLPGNEIFYLACLEEIEENGRIDVFDHSPGATDGLSLWGLDRPILTHQELLCITANNGVYLTFFGTDGVMVAPHLANQGIVSIAYLDPMLGGAVLHREKGIERLPLEELWQSTNSTALYQHLLYALDDKPTREKHCQRLAELYPFPEANPARKIAEAILA